MLDDDDMQKKNTKRITKATLYNHLCLYYLSGMCNDLYILDFVHGNIPTEPQETCSL